MEKTSHYYALLALCLMRGIKSEIALKIAYASQFVDDAKINKISFNTKYAGQPFTDDGNLSVLYNIATCHSYLKIDTFNYQSMINDTTLFHFFPGGVGESFTKKLRCRENPDILNVMIEEALKEVPLNPIRLGMLLHVYADTFSHQGFSGLLSIENEITELETDEFQNTFASALRRLRNRIIEKLDRTGLHFIPAYGHGKALVNPDIPFRVWSYFYDNSDALHGYEFSNVISNRYRYDRAFDRISGFLSKIRDLKAYEGGHAATDDRVPKIFHDALYAIENMRKKTRRWRRLIRSIRPDCDREYDENEWLRGAFVNFDEVRFHARTVVGAELASDFRDSPWFSFVLAVRSYKAEALKLLEDRGLAIPL